MRKLKDNKVVLQLIRDLPQKKINDKTFGEAFQLDGIPLWYLLEFLIDAYFPKPFKAPWEIEEDIRRKHVGSFYDRLKHGISSFILRKGILLNEEIKHVISGGDHPKENEKFDVLFVQLTPQILKKNGKLVFLESEKIIEALKRRGIKPLVLVADPVSKNSLLELRRYCPLLYKYQTNEVPTESKLLARTLSRMWKNLDEKTKMKMFEVGNKSYWRYFKLDLDFLFSEEILFIFIKFYLTFKKILKNHDIKMVYLTSLGGFYGPAILGAAHQLERKVLYASHGYTMVPTIRRDFAENVLVMASGAEEKKNFIRGGFKKRNVFITGSPFYDEIVKHKARVKRKADGVSVCLLTTQLVESKLMKKEEYFCLIRKTIKQLSEVNEIKKIVIKLHPAEKYRKEYESIIKSLNLKNVEINQSSTKAELYSVMANSDLIIGFGSTALLEGLMLGKDAIHLDPFLKTPEFYTFREGCVCTRDLENLRILVRKILADKEVKKVLKRKRERYLRRCFYKIDGKAHERIAEVIEKILQKRR